MNKEKTTRPPLTRDKIAIIGKQYLNPEMTAKRIAEELGIGVFSVRNAILNLKKAGVVFPHRAGVKKAVYTEIAAELTKS